MMTERFAGRRGAKTWVLRYTPNEVSFYGDFEQCSSDVQLIIRTPGGEDVVKPLRASRAGSGRHDLRCNIPGWPRDTYWMRVLGWCFLNTSHLSWDEFNRKETVGKGFKRYIWQVNHEEGHPEHCILEKMVLGRQSENSDHYAVHGKDFYGTVYKKPSGKVVKKPAKRQR